MSDSNFKVLTQAQFASLSEDTDLVKAMSRHNSFSAEDLGETYIFTGEAVKDSDGLYQFPVFHVNLGIPLTINQYKLMGTQNEENKLNWFQDSYSGGVVDAIEFVKFTESKAGGKLIFPKFCYMDEPMMAKFNITDEDEFSEILRGMWSEITPGQQSKRKDMLKWARRQEPVAVMHTEYLTKAGNPTADTLKLRAGTLTYRAVRRQDKLA